MHRAVALGLCLTAVLPLAACATNEPAAIGSVSRVTYSQMQVADPDFDEGEYVIEGDDLDPLRQIMRDYDIDPATFDDGGAPCPDAIVSELTIEFDDATPDHTFTMSGCEQETFAVEAGVFLINYSSGALTRENGYRWVGFSQYQPAPGVDEHEFVQDLPEEVARFVALLRRFDIDPDRYVSATEPGCTDGLQSAVALYSVSDIDPHVIARMQIDDCGAAQDGFDAQATALLSEWRIKSAA